MTQIVPALLLYCTLAAANAYAENEFSVGVEGFRDVYKEPNESVTTHTDFGSVTAGDQYNFGETFLAIQGRYSQGNSDYKSASGDIDHIPDKEGELRLLAGLRFNAWHGIIMPYIGIGSRLYFDQGKGLVSNTGSLAYDRHIWQNYIPVGLTDELQYGDWRITPNIEYDALLYGQVNSHLAYLNNMVPTNEQEPNITNIQHNGYGLRGELMVGQQYQYFGWQLGPFVRYWNISQSDLQYTPNLPVGEGYGEPENKRIQYGVAAKVNF